MSLTKYPMGSPPERGTNRQPVARTIVRLLAVVVLYKIKPRDSSTLQTLLASAATIGADELDLKIVVWDNTPGGQDVEALPEGVIYTAAPHNPGLAQAYNQVLELAEAEGYTWFLTLDQDSSLPPNFVARIAGLTRELTAVDAVGAIVPQVIADGRIISPFQFLLGAWPRWLPRGYVGISKRAAYAANSGSVLRVSALQEIGGYDPLFPLDLSDTNLFHRLHQARKQVFVAGDLQMRHDFALLNKQKRMSLERYRASLRDDCAFWDLYMSRAARLERILRFSLRAARDFFKKGETDFRKQTLSELKRRLFTSRRRRIAEWTAWATLRSGQAAMRAEAIAPSSPPASSLASPKI